jgi:predicted tellurium resistance membrane protein TerC
LRVEEFYDAGAFADDLGRHAATAAATTAAEAATTAAAAITTAAAAAEAAATAATEAIAAAKAATATAAAKAAPVFKSAAAAAVETVIAEAVALVPATSAAIPAAPSIKTHCPVRLPDRPSSIEKRERWTRTQAFRHAQGMPLESCHNPEWHHARTISSQLRWHLIRYLRHSVELRQLSNMDIATLIADPAAWAALVTLVVMEVVLGIDNLIFISILTNKLPEHQQQKARRIGIGLALVMRVLLLSMIWVIVSLTTPVFDLGLQGATGAHGEPSFETAFSWRDLILIAGGLFLVWKATKEIHHTLDPVPSDHAVLDKKQVAGLNFGSAIFQIILLDMVFSVDSILTAVGMTDEIAIMVTAVLITVGIMLIAADPLANFIKRNPTVVMLALGFLLMIGAVLIADGFGVHVPKGYIYAAMAFSALVEMLNMFARRSQSKRDGAGNPPAGH